MSRPGFQVYHVDMESVQDMTDAQLGKLFRLLYRYSIGDDIADKDVPASIRYAFRFMSQRVQGDANAYDKKVEQTRKAAERRWNNNANASERIRTHANASNNNNNSTQLNNNSTQLNNNGKTNPALMYAQRNDDLNDVLNAL